jgi:DNA polymerase
LPKELNLDALQEASRHCQGCPLYRDATQTVFGEGAHQARVMFIGEQPGDLEDRAGRPFVGPAGKVLEKALDTAGINRADVYVTNAVKHFKFELRGKRRIHKKPNSVEITACKPWLDSEIAALQPDIIVCLGGTAAKAVLGRQIQVTRVRGQLLQSDNAAQVAVTVHPSSLLRAPDEQSRRAAMDQFVNDLCGVRTLMEKLPKARRLLRHG